MGGMGLLVLAALDASFLPFPQVADALIVYLSAARPELMPYYAGMTTIGSVGGGAVLFLLARRGGEAFLRRRFKARQIERGLRLYARFGILTVLIASMLPPPTPFKLFVLLAGASGLQPWRFLVALSVGRAVRYFGTGYLAVRYGERALDVVREQGGPVGIALAMAIAAGGLGFYFWRKRQAASQMDVQG